jgi:hypothetical protein
MAIDSIPSGSAFPSTSSVATLPTSPPVLFQSSTSPNRVVLSPTSPQLSASSSQSSTTSTTSTTVIQPASTITTSVTSPSSPPRGENVNQRDKKKESEVRLKVGERKRRSEKVKRTVKEAMRRYEEHGRTDMKFLRREEERKPQESVAIDSIPSGSAFPSAYSGATLPTSPPALHQSSTSPNHVGVSHTSPRVSASSSLSSSTSSTSSTVIQPASTIPTSGAASPPSSMPQGGGVKQRDEGENEKNPSHFRSFDKDEGRRGESWIKQDAKRRSEEEYPKRAEEVQIMEERERQDDVNIDNMLPSPSGLNAPTPQAQSSALLNQRYKVTPWPSGVHGATLSAELDRMLLEANRKMRERLGKEREASRTSPKTAAGRIQYSYSET